MCSPGVRPCMLNERRMVCSTSTLGAEPVVNLSVGPFTPHLGDLSHIKFHEKTPPGNPLRISLATGDVGMRCCVVNRYTFKISSAPPTCAFFNSSCVPCVCIYCFGFSDFVQLWNLMLKPWFQCETSLMHASGDDLIF